MVDARREPPVVVETPWLRLLPPATRWVFQGPPHVRALAAAAWGVPFAAEACRASTAAGRSALWLGPEEYLLLAPDTAAERAAIGSLERSLQGVPHALVDVGHRQVALEVRSDQASVLLNSSCPLDLDLAVFPVGTCTRTVFAKADIVLWRTRRDVFHLEVWRSFLHYVTGILTEVAREFSDAG